jgi:hypothetical protein
MTVRGISPGHRGSLAVFPPLKYGEQRPIASLPYGKENILSFNGCLSSQCPPYLGGGGSCLSLSVVR